MFVTCFFQIYGATHYYQQQDSFVAAGERRLRRPHGHGPPELRERPRRPVWKSKFDGVFVLNHRVVLGAPANTRASKYVHGVFIWRLAGRARREFLSAPRARGRSHRSRFPSSRDSTRAHRRGRSLYSNARHACAGRVSASQTHFVASCVRESTAFLDALTPLAIC